MTLTCFHQTKDINGAKLSWRRPGSPAQHSGERRLRSADDRDRADHQHDVQAGQDWAAVPLLASRLTTAITAAKNGVPGPRGPGPPGARAPRRPGRRRRPVTAS